MNKKGGAIVESAMIFPLVVMVIASLIFIMIYFHAQLCERVNLHILLRAESGEICGNITYENRVESDFTVYKETQQIYSKGIIKTERNLLLNNRNKEIGARKYLIDEGRFVRMTGIMDNE